MKTYKYGAARMYARCVITTFLADGRPHRKNYKAPPGALLGERNVQDFVVEHLKMLAEGEPGTLYRIVNSGPAQFSFIHPAVDKVARRAAEVELRDGTVMKFAVAEVAA